MVTISCLGVQTADASAADGGGAADGSPGDGASDASGVDGGQTGDGSTCVGDPAACEGLLCTQCSFGVAAGEPDLCSETIDQCGGAGTTGNCFEPSSSCAGLGSDADRLRCWALYACMRDSHCVAPGSGNPLPCWCGTNVATCPTDDAPPTQANGPCLSQFFAAAKSTSSAYIFSNLNNANLPLGLAYNLAICRSLYCGTGSSSTSPTACPLW